MENNKNIEQKLNENNIKIKNLRINRNKKIGDALFSTANIALTQIASYNCVCSAFDGNEWLYIPFVPLCFLFAFNCKKISEKLGGEKLFKDIIKFSLRKLLLLFGFL